MLKFIIDIICKDTPSGLSSLETNEPEYIEQHSRECFFGSFYHQMLISRENSGAEKFKDTFTDLNSYMLLNY